LASHRYTMAVQDLDDTALAEIELAAELGCAGSVLVCLHECIDCFIGQPAIEADFWG
jgi:hypothetical protein